jgi:zinc protease
MRAGGAGPHPAARHRPAASLTEETLPNGLHVIYSEDHSTPVVAVDIWYNVGSKHEQPGRTGFAHLFEHMMFKGSKNVPDGQHFGLLEGAGARAGADINGTTAWDRTNYFEQLPSNQLELALWLEADRMGTLLDAHPGEARQPARGGEERAPPERGQPAVRLLAGEDGGRAPSPPAIPTTTR